MEKSTHFQNLCANFFHNNQYFIGRETQSQKNAGQLTDSRWFWSGSRLCNGLVPGHFSPHWMQYEMGLSAGQSSSLGKPITLTKVNTTGAENKPHVIVSGFEALIEFLRMTSNRRSKGFQA